jgi:hypothetical protein
MPSLFKLPAGDDAPRGVDDATLVGDALGLAAEKVGAADVAVVDTRAIRARYAVGHRYRAEAITNMVLKGGAGAALALVACAALGPIAGAAVALSAIVADSMRAPSPGEAR